MCLIKPQLPYLVSFQLIIINMEPESEGILEPGEQVSVEEDEIKDSDNKDKNQNKTHLFDSFDWESLSIAEQSAHDFTFFINSPQVNVNPGPSSSSLPPATCGLLSPPDFSTYHNPHHHLPFPQLEKPVIVSESVHTHAISEFLAFGPKSRASRKRVNNLDCTGHRRPLSRRSSIFQRRLETFRPYLTYLISLKEGWNQVKILPDIASISSSSIQQNDEERSGNPEIKFAWDHMQSLGFQELSEPIVLIGYTLKIAPSSILKVDKLCSNVGVLSIPLNPTITNRCCLFLEDSTGKIRLELSRQYWEENLKFHQIVSGIPIAIKGLCSDGKLWVDEILFATPPQPVVPLTCIPNEVDMVFVSGLNVGRSCTDWSALDSLFDYLQGLSGSEPEQESLMIRKTRVFFLGNSFPKRKRWNPDRREELIAQNCDIADKLDYYLSGLANTAEVFIVPGENDPTHQLTLPQPPLHKRLFPNAMQYPTLRCLTNPAKICLGMSNSAQSSQEDNNNFDENVMNLVLCSGTNVKETMDDCCEIDCPLEMCTKLMEWSHLFPASTDDGEIAEDLFSLSTLPHLFVVGGLSEFKIKEWKGVKIVSVPAFSSSGKIVILHKNGAISPFSFKICIK